MIDKLVGIMKVFSETLTIEESLTLEKGVMVRIKSGNHPDYFIKIVDNKSEKME